MTTISRENISWRKSSYSASSANCVEIAFLGDGWRKSSYSNSTANCVEIAFTEQRVGTRDSKNTGGPALTYPAASWSAFLTELR